jgi:hypothetical protein
MAKKNWRAVLRAIHRDLGYACVGLTLVYAISGVAVNHIHEWNPNYAFEREAVAVGTLEYATPAEDETAREVLRRLGLEPVFDTTFQRDPDSLRIIQGPTTIDVDLRTGRGLREDVTTRPLIHETNVLHLNHPKGAWTWVADAFAVSLAFLALSGMLILKGRQGVLKRGLWFTIVGFAIPAVFLLLHAG